jgi:hypothetical protein
MISEYVLAPGFGGVLMEPLIMINTTPEARPEWRDVVTDRDPLPAIVAIDADGATRETFSQITKVDRETTDDK